MSNCKIFKHLELLGPSLQHRLPVNLLCLLICLCWPGWLLADRGDRSVRTSEGRVKISLTFTHTSTSWSIAAVETEGNCQLLLLTLGTGDHVRICVSLSFPWVYKELIIFVDSSWRAHGLHGETWAKRDPDTGYTHEGQVRPASRGPQVEPRPSSQVASVRMLTTLPSTSWRKLSHTTTDFCTSALSGKAPVWNPDTQASPKAQRLRVLSEFFQRISMKWIAYAHRKLGKQKVD